MIQSNTEYIINGNVGGASEKTITTNPDNRVTVGVEDPSEPDMEIFIPEQKEGSDNEFAFRSKSQGNYLVSVWDGSAAIAETSSPDPYYFLMNPVEGQEPDVFVVTFNDGTDQCMTMPQVVPGAQIIYSSEDDNPNQKWKFAKADTKKTRDLA